MTRDQRLIAIFTCAAVLLAMFVGTRVATRDDAAPVQAITRKVAVGTDGKLSLLWVGDTMLGDAGQPFINQLGYDWPLAGVRSLLDADFVVANAESPITSLADPWDPAQESSYHMYPPAATALAHAGVDAISLANNHAMDRGPNGLSDTLMYAGAAGLTAIGAGENIERAQQPLILRTGAGTVGIVAFGEYYGRDSDATRSQPGVMGLDAEAMRAGIARARAVGADSVVAFVHWGENYQEVEAKQRYWAQQFARAGYALVVGTGSHTAQPIDFIDGMPVVYSVGNFVFAAPGRFTEHAKPGVGLVLTTELGRGQPVKLTIRCIRTNNEFVSFQPQPCSDAQARAFIPTLHPQVTMQGTVGILTAPPRRQAS